MEKFAISREFTRSAISDLLAFAALVKASLTASARLLANPPLVEALAQAIEALSEAETRAVSGSKAERVARDARRVDLLAVLEKIALQVQLQATEAADETLVYEAGFSPRPGQGRRSFAPLGAAEIAFVSRGKNSGTVSGKCRRIDGAVKFALEWSDDAGATWHNGQYSKGASFLLQGLAPEKRYWLRARPLGTNNRIGDWSEPVTLFVL